MQAAIIALAVLALHLLFGFGIALAPTVGAPAGVSRRLVVVTELPPPVTSQSAGAIALNLSLPLAPPRPPRPPIPVLPVSPHPGVIVDAVPADVAQVTRICGAWVPQRGSRGAVSREPEILIRVEADGRVSDTRLLAGTGSVERDAALEHCLLTFARLTPISVEGHAVAAWQTLRAPPIGGPRP
jgi:hypothetical protein